MPIDKLERLVVAAMGFRWEGAEPADDTPGALLNLEGKNEWAIEHCGNHEFVHQDTRLLDGAIEELDFLGQVAYTTAKR